MQLPGKLGFEWEKKSLGRGVAQTTEDGTDLWKIKRSSLSNQLYYWRESTNFSKEPKSSSPNQTTRR